MQSFACRGKSRHGRKGGGNSANVQYYKYIIIIFYFSLTQYILSRYNFYKSTTNDTSLISIACDRGRCIYFGGIYFNIIKIQ